jgi:hypothetical protein
MSELSREQVRLLSLKQVKTAISLHCRLMGSHPYYYEDELLRWQEDPSCLVVFEDKDGDGLPRLRAYTRARSS